MAVEYLHGLINEPGDVDVYSFDAVAGTEVWLDVDLTAVSLDSVIELIDANYANRSELLLRHQHVGVDLRWDWAREVLQSMTRLWRRPVRLETLRDGKRVRMGHDGDNVTEESLEKKAAAKSS